MNALALQQYLDFAYIAAVILFVLSQAAEFAGERALGCSGGRGWRRAGRRRHALQSRTGAVPLDLHHADCRRWSWHPAWSRTHDGRAPANCGEPCSGRAFGGSDRYNSAITCTGYGADDDDLIARIANSQSGGVTGSYGTAVGTVDILSNGQANEILSFNSNDNLQVSGFTGPPSNNTACAFSETLDPFDGPAAFADGTSNLLTPSPVLPAIRPAPTPRTLVADSQPARWRGARSIVTPMRR